MGRFEHSFEFMDWRYAAGAVLDVFHENQRNEQLPGAIKASADLWCMSESLRLQMWTRAMHFWCVRSGLHFTCFPLSVDSVSKIYLRIRKRKKEEIDGFDKEVGGKPPQPKDDDEDQPLFA